MPIMKISIFFRISPYGINLISYRAELRSVIVNVIPSPYTANCENVHLFSEYGCLKLLVCHRNIFSYLLPWCLCVRLQLRCTFSWIIMCVFLALALVFAIKTEIILQVIRDNFYLTCQIMSVISTLFCRSFLPRLYLNLWYIRNKERCTINHFNVIFKLFLFEIIRNTCVMLKVISLQYLEKLSLNYHSPHIVSVKCCWSLVYFY